MRKFTKNKLPFILIFLTFAVLVIAIANFVQLKNLTKLNNFLQSKPSLIPQEIAQKYSPPPTSLATPSPKPLTFEEMNTLYGPCAHLPVIFYHHIQNMDVAKAAGQQSLTVATDIFINQMQYLKDKGYVTLGTNNITDFFDRGIPIPRGGVILTFDDGYEDFYVNVLPILKQNGFRGVMALPTGLVGNPGYLTWDEIAQAASNGVEIVNHTWSHADLATGNTSLIQREITTADDQLTARGYNSNKALVYPYGAYNSYTISFLQTKGYTLAFTTNPGSVLCKKLRYVLPRIRIGNASLAAYGF